jgi:hypothetical protein
VLSLVQIARFADLYEAQVAASMLRANGLMPFLPEEYRGSTDFFLWQAMGGFRLLVVEDEAEAAHALIAPHRKADPEALKWGEHPQVVTGAWASLFWALLEPTGGLAQKQLRTGMRPLPLAMLVLCLAAALSVLFLWVGWVMQGGW